ncbi:transaldolase family protein [Faecalicatena sp. AGMB00832]|uniref:Transaldolase family protein n=1 Tax=Faecalicatena faecalis TaxID=2726362 RepID=A0ABS6D2W6_9FIRM|nr:MULTISPECIES: transaldolase family protein [Faecalicatena]MBU3875944.1 transaldolase family protein [Faecalicatena faecalis]MCI6467640.1 transaldolase family protein [Faecalicatena sp.]MDY5619816.1 transaldolase family protein [Lachnospiraceae bacterium]
MQTVNYSLASLVGGETQIISSDEGYVRRALHQNISLNEYEFLKKTVRYIGASDRFKDVIDLFKVPEGETPAGFKIEYNMKENQILEIDLVRNISYDKNGKKRPTKFIYSADTANPYEVEPIKNLIGNLTCNPGIIYDLFINNPAANIGNKFKTRNEVMKEIADILGPGCDISVEVNNPFADFNQILEEAEEFREMFSDYRMVIKIPHTGPVNAANVGDLLVGDKRLSTRWNQAATKDYLYGHNLALKMKEHGFRVNYTLMFEPWQTGMALQAKPYFINSFVRQRFGVTTYINGMLTAYQKTYDDRFLQELRNFMIQWDILSKDDQNVDLRLVEKIARETIEYRKINEREGFDGMDGVRHNLRMLRNSNLEDTRLIICSIEGSRMYPELDKLMTEDEFKDMTDRIVITTEPSYLAQNTSAPQIITYQRRFMNAANGEK